jgi:hypothetical protein
MPVLQQKFGNAETANESETRLLRSSTACPVFNELVTLLMINKWEIMGVK